MASAVATFRAKAPVYMKKLMADFVFSDLDAAAVMGNAGHESGGLTIFQELHPIAGRGGWGWFQWTGPRRVNAEAYWARNGMDPRSDEANYAFLFVELKGPESAAVNRTKAAIGLQNKVIAFEEAYERAGVKAYDSRVKWANIALDAFRGAPAAVPPIEPPLPPTPVPPPVTPPVAPGPIPQPSEGFFARLIKLILSIFRKG